MVSNGENLLANKKNSMCAFHKREKEKRERKKEREREEKRERIYLCTLGDQ